ncbi:shikimate kinase [Candidatus Pelagibacter sp.]|nr:shikimate kinase [Candidatus Pelagibacter sp.]
MKSKENLVFLGMMGSGKTSIGLIVSKRLKLNFFDIDKEIEEESGVKISKMFEAKGEAYFRKLEENITLKILSKNNCVISLGGGAFLNKNIKNEILKNHLSFWLSWNEKTLVERIKNSKKRPLAFNATKNELVEIIKKRSNIYSKALYKVECEQLTKNQIADKVLDIYETR